MGSTLSMFIIKKSHLSQMGFKDYVCKVLV